MTEYFYDSYAIIEFIGGSKGYKKFFEEPSGVTTRLNLMEIYYSMMDEPDIAEDVFASFSTVATDFSDEELKGAMRLRKELKAKKPDVSYVDALGYHIARERGLLFLTGDMAFEGLEGVEYVK